MARFRAVIVVLAIATGLAGVFFGVAAFGLRCFDTCPVGGAAELKADLPIAALGIYALAGLVAAFLYDKPRVCGILLFVAAAAVLILAVVSAIQSRSVNQLVIPLVLIAIPAVGGVLAFMDAKESR